MTTHTPATSKAEKHILFAFCLITAFIPFLSINMPRSYGFTPALCGIIFFGLYYFFGKEKPKISIQTATFVIITLGISVLSLLWAKYFDTSKAKLLKLFALLPPQILLISLITSLKKEQLKPLIKLLPIGFICCSAFLIFEILTKGTLHNIVRGEAISAIADPDDFNRGSTALALYAFSIFATMCLHFKKRISAIIVFIPIASAVLISESLSAQLALGIGLLFLFAFPYTSKIAHKVLKFGIIALMLTAPFFISFIYDHFAQTLHSNPVLAQAYAGNRLEIWDYVSRYALQNPLLGYGIEATRDVTDFDSKAVFWHSSDVLHPHNFVMQIWIEFGLFGILVASSLMYVLLTNIERKFSYNQQKILLPTVMATLVPAAFAYGLWQGLWIGLMFHVAAVALLATTLTHDEHKS